MDSKLEKAPRTLWQWGSWSFVRQQLAGGFIGSWRMYLQDLSRAGRPANRVSDSVWAFEDLIPIRGNILPLESVFLDAVIGGSMEDVLIEKGAFADARQPLVQLSNTSTRLSASQADA